MEQNVKSVGNIHIVEADCRFSSDRSTAKIVVESSNPVLPRAIEELSSTAARNLALAFAATAGVSSPSINGSIEGPLPYNRDGEAIDDLNQSNQTSPKPLPPTHHRMQPYRYRAAIPVCRKML